MKTVTKIFKYLYVTSSGKISKNVLISDAMFIIGLASELGANQLIVSKLTMAVALLSRYIRMRGTSSGEFEK